MMIDSSVMGLGYRVYYFKGFICKEIECLLKL